MIRIALINTQMIKKQVSVTNQALHRLSSINGGSANAGSSPSELERKESLTLSASGAMEVSQAAAPEEIADLLIDRVTFKKYRCS